MRLLLKRDERQTLSEIQVSDGVHLYTVTGDSCTVAPVTLDYYASMGDLEWYTDRSDWDAVFILEVFRDRGFYLELPPITETLTEWRDLEFISDPRSFSEVPWTFSGLFSRLRYYKKLGPSEKSTHMYDLPMFRTEDRRWVVGVVWRKGQWVWVANGDIGGDGFLRPGFPLGRTRLVGTGVGPTPVAALESAMQHTKQQMLEIQKEATSFLEFAK